MTLTGYAPGGDASGLALYNSGGGSNASASLDFYTTSANNNIPQSKVKALDDGAYSTHLIFLTKPPGAPSNPITERLRITPSPLHSDADIEHLVGALSAIWGELRSEKAA